MEQRLEPLFTPWKIGNCEIKNRIVLTSMGGTNLLGWMEVNHFDKDGARFIMEVAKNNCGLVLPGCQPVYNPMYGKWLYKNEKMYQDLAKWMPEFHKTGAKLFVLDGAVIVGTAAEAECDKLCVVTAPFEVSVERIAARDGISPEMAARRLNAQMPEAALTARADYILPNTSTREALAKAANELCDTLIGEGCRT